MDYYSEIKKISVLDHEEEKELSRAYLKGDKLAGHRLVYHNMRLVLKITQEYKGAKAPFDDLFQEGNLGLIRAIDKYDPELGWKFSTYASYWIRQGIQRYLYQYGYYSAIKMPVHLGQFFIEMQNVERKLLLQLDRDPTPEETAAVLHVKPEQVITVKRVAADTFDYNGDLNDEKLQGRSYSFGAILKDPGAADPSDIYDEKELQEIIHNLLESLTPKEKEMIKLIYGLDGEEPHNLSEVGKMYDISRERVRQIRIRAIQKLQHGRRRTKLKAFY